MNIKPFALLLVVAGPTALIAEDRETDMEARYPQQMSARNLLVTCASSSVTRIGRERRRYCAGFVSGVEEGVRPFACRPT